MHICLLSKLTKTNRLACDGISDARERERGRPVMDTIFSIRFVYSKADSSLFHYFRILNMRVLEQFFRIGKKKVKIIQHDTCEHKRPHRSQVDRSEYSRFHVWFRFAQGKWENHEWNGESMLHFKSEYKPVFGYGATRLLNWLCLYSSCVVSHRFDDKFFVQSASGSVAFSGTRIYDATKRNWAKMFTFDWSNVVVAVIVVVIIIIIVVAACSYRTHIRVNERWNENSNSSRQLMFNVHVKMLQSI